MSKIITASDIEIKIDKEFEGLLPAHSKEESEELRKAVLAEGFTDSLKVWYPENETKKPTLVDGHHCYKLWCSLPDDTTIAPPAIREVKLPDREAVKLWMLRRQLARRNLNPQTATILLGRLYNETKKAAGGDRKSNHQNDDLIGHVGKTSEAIAEETGRSQATVERAGDYVDALDAIGLVNGKAKADIESGSLKVSKQDVIAVGNLDQAGIGRALKNLRNGKSWDWQPSDDNGHGGEGPPPGVDGHGRKIKKRAKRVPTKRDVLKDKAGTVLPDSCRDAFADPSLGQLIEELEVVEDLLTVDPWVKKAGKLVDHYPFLLLAKFDEHACEALHRVQLALESLRAGVPHGVCPKCNGIDSNKGGKTCRGCRGCGHVPETRYSELTK